LQAALERARAGVSANADWQPFTWTFDNDDVEMALVPVGCFRMGSDDGEEDEKPVHEVCIDAPFWIDRTEVTNAQFDGLGGQAERESTWTDPNRPRERISWFEARDFCALRGARLPTEAEWEYAARGPDGLVYPWGDQFVAENAVYGSNSGGETADVGSRPGGVSWVGALDMSGNVYEWVSSVYLSYPYTQDLARREDEGYDGSGRVLRGGYWGSTDVLYLRAANRDWNDPDITFNVRGLRCSRLVF
jgi:formylglycine-generating enzyme required for sulfatase activity